MIGAYLRLAYQSTKRRRLRSWLTMLGIFIGIAAVVALISLSQGLKNAIQEQFLALGSDKIVIQAAGGGFGPPGTGTSVPLTTKEKETIEDVAGIDLAVGRLIRIAKFEFKDETQYSYMVSFPKYTQEQELVIESNTYVLSSGRFPNDGSEVIIGADVSQTFFEKPIAVRDKLIIQDKSFQVVGILQKSGNPQKDTTVIMPEEKVREILGIGNDIDIIAARVAAGEDVAVVSEQVEKELRKQRDVEEGKENFVVETPEQLLGTLNSILLIVQGVLIGIAAISLLVGGLGIMNTMYTAVVERTREIGIMKAVGATQQQISTLFIIESGMLGLFGGAIGVLLGVGISKGVEYIGYQMFQSFLIRADVSIWLVIGALLFAFVVGGLSGVLPARQAAKLQPVDALRR